MPCIVNNCSMWTILHISALIHRHECINLSFQRFMQIWLNENQFVKIFNDCCSILVDSLWNYKVFKLSERYSWWKKSFSSSCLSLIVMLDYFCSHWTDRKLKVTVPSRIHPTNQIGRSRDSQMGTQISRGEVDALGLICSDCSWRLAPHSHVNYECCTAPKHVNHLREGENSPAVGNCSRQNFNSCT